MSVAAMYIAIPPGSGLYTMLEQGKVFRSIVYKIFPNIYTFEELASDEIDEIMESLFGDDLEAQQAQQAFDQLRVEMIHTLRSYPGIEYRRARLEGTSEIKEILLKAFLRRQVENPELMVDRLIYGDKVLGQGNRLELISRQLVSEGARILRQVNIEEFFPVVRGRIRYPHPFEKWCKLYWECSIWQRFLSWSLTDSIKARFLSKRAKPHHLWQDGDTSSTNPTFVPPPTAWQGGRTLGLAQNA